MSLWENTPYFIWSIIQDRLQDADMTGAGTRVTALPIAQSSGLGWQSGKVMGSVDVALTCLDRAPDQLILKELILLA
jgi:hypothetical protein